MSVFGCSKNSSRWRACAVRYGQQTRAKDIDGALPRAEYSSATIAMLPESEAHFRALFSVPGLAKNMAIVIYVTEIGF
jgi:hypothetical protein